jgi:hypothetical protein
MEVNYIVVVFLCCCNDSGVVGDGECTVMRNQVADCGVDTRCGVAARSN